MIEVSRYGDITKLSLDRPEKLNALSPKMLSELNTELSKANSEEVVIISGKGSKAFSSGADIEHGYGLSIEEAYEYVRETNQLFNEIEAFSRPVIASIDGVALGGGLELALACDLRVGSEESELGLPEIDIGAVPGTGGIHRLPAIVGDERARWMIFTGEIIDAATAEEWGLLGNVYAQQNLEECVLDLANSIADKPPFALSAAKRGLNEATRPDRAAIEFETWMVTALYGTTAYREGIEEFVDDSTE